MSVCGRLLTGEMPEGRHLLGELLTMRIAHSQYIYLYPPRSVHFSFAWFAPSC